MLTDMHSIRLGRPLCPANADFPLFFLSFANEVINKAGVSPVVRNVATEAGANATRQSRQEKRRWLYFCLGCGPAEWFAQIILFTCFYISNIHLQMVDCDYYLCHSFPSRGPQSSSHIDLCERNLLLKLNEEIATGNAGVQSQGLFNSLLIWRILEVR